MLTSQRKVQLIQIKMGDYAKTVDYEWSELPF